MNKDVTVKCFLFHNIKLKCFFVILLEVTEAVTVLLTFIRCQSYEQTKICYANVIRGSTVHQIFWSRNLAI